MSTTAGDLASCTSSCCRPKCQHAFISRSRPAVRGQSTSQAAVALAGHRSRGVAVRYLKLSANQSCVDSERQGQGNLSCSDVGFHMYIGFHLYRHVEVRTSGGVAKQAA